MPSKSKDSHFADATIMTAKRIPVTKLNVIRILTFGVYPINAA